MRQSIFQSKEEEKYQKKNGIEKIIDFRNRLDDGNNKSLQLL